MTGIALAIWGLVAAIFTIHVDRQLFVNKNAVRFWLLSTLILFFLSLTSEFVQ